ncbi:Hypothetical Protein SLY_0087 [Strawberry lethal yellows phytoplasma (CPA) str. NZSb11]|uniref:Uncharacterized protein n=1 Tax=Strawberry lethal yellows phytoplasma (CPA) str. NZSb11 TaxID=980422 RepID=R4RZR0_PHYAS|nr:Hypothetical Protein SLY_0087 [Strawberry lethal yellows phytoplasma (CPA) str. NZSb11]
MKNLFFLFSLYKKRKQKNKTNDFIIFSKKNNST